MFRLYSIVFIITISLLLAWSCKKADERTCFKSTGDIIEETRPVPEFNVLQINDALNITLTQDTFNSIKIKGGENLIPFIKTENQENTLIIWNDNTCNFLRSYKKDLSVTLTYKSLDSIAIFGQCKLFSTNANTSTSPVYIEVMSDIASCDLKFDNAHIRLYVWDATGDYAFSGNTEYFYVLNRGTAFVRAENMVAKICSVKNRSTGDVFINVTDELKVELTNLGDIFYLGNPSIEIEEESSDGKLKPFTGK